MTGVPQHQYAERSARRRARFHQPRERDRLSQPAGGCADRRGQRHAGYCAAQAAVPSAVSGVGGRSAGDPARQPRDFERQQRASPALNRISTTAWSAACRTSNRRRNALTPRAIPGGGDGIRDEKFYPAPSVADDPMLLLASLLIFASSPRRPATYRRQHQPDRATRRRAAGAVRVGSAVVQPLPALARPAAAGRSRFSLQYQIPVSTLLNQYIWNSFLLAAVAMVLY